MRLSEFYWAGSRLVSACMNSLHLPYRPDVDGLRAVAVLAVVVFHAFPSLLPGGFVGVDIFFVISGYLITTILLKALTKGEFSLLDFYSRRIRRIFPALILVLLFCMSIGWWVLLAAGEYRALGKHVAAGAGYLSNLVLMRESGYFDTTAELKPLLHLWSLAIEEQFYLFWPLIMMVVFRAGLQPLVIIVLLIGASFFLNVSEIDHNAVEVFYAPQTRVWELLVGSLLAYVNLLALSKFDRGVSCLPPRAPDTGKECRHVPNFLSLLGLALIVGALIGVNQRTVFPGWWALLPTLGAFCLIAAGEQAWFNRRMLAAKPMVAIGLISYPLYLWHWPLLSLARIIEGQTLSRGIRMTVIALSIMLAWATYQFVERRIRFNRHWSIPTSLLVLLILIGLSGYWVYSQEGQTIRYERFAKLAEELGDSKWEKKGLYTQPDCVQKFGPYKFCMVSNIHNVPTAMILGDSHSNHFYPGLAKVFAASKENLLNLAMGGCLPFFDVESGQKGATDVCRSPTNKALTLAIDSPEVKTVILASRGPLFVSGQGYGLERAGERFLRYTVDPALPDFSTIFRTAMAETLRRLVAAGKHVVYVIDIPELGFDPATCLDVRPFRLSSVPVKNPCAVLRADVETRNKEYRELVMGVLKDFPTVKVWDPTKKLCDDQYCWAVREGQLLYRDNNHLSESGALWLGARYVPE